WHGTNGGMGAKGYGLMAPDDGLKPDEVLQVIAFIRSNSVVKATGNE
ncbi:MAG TPA: cytochrome C, partial [Methylophilus sp.]|nr:cytochrome C [Methylophilus sp.]